MPAGVAVGDAVAARVGVEVETPGPPPRGEGPTANKFEEASAEMTERKTKKKRRSGEIIRLKCKAWHRVQLESDANAPRGQDVIFSAIARERRECKRQLLPALPPSDSRGAT